MEFYLLCLVILSRWPSPCHPTPQ